LVRLVRSTLAASVAAAASAGVAHIATIGRRTTNVAQSLAPGLSAFAAAVEGFDQT
jgi:hypothetical protein